MTEPAIPAGTSSFGATRRRVRTGRPPLERAGEVEARILEAAHKVFLDRGFDGASIDLIAETARSGKPTIYARYPNKQALFVAAVAQRIAFRNARVESHRPTGATLEARLVSIGAALLRETLTEELIGLFRLAVAQAHRFPDLASSVVRMARERGTATVARLLAEAAECGEFGVNSAGREDRLPLAAQFFAELILVPLAIRALFGESLEALRAEIDAHVAQRVVFFLAACEHGGIG